MDEAGNQALVRSAKLAFEKDMNVLVISIENGKDAADVVKENLQNLEKAVSEAVPAMEYFSNSLFSKYSKDNPQDKKKIVAELMDIISSFSSEIDRQHWIRKLAQRIDVSERVLYEMLERILNQKNRISSAKTGPGDFKEESFQAKKRSDILKQEIIGTILADKKVWKKVANELKDKFDNYFQDGEVKNIILNGQKYDFDFGKVQINSGSVNNFLRKLYFENRYNFSQSGGDMEVESVDNSESFHYYWKELEKELKKDKMKEVERDIKKAEESGDRESVDVLSGEFAKLMKEIREMD